MFLCIEMKNKNILLAQNSQNLSKVGESWLNFDTRLKLK